MQFFAASWICTCPFHSYYDDTQVCIDGRYGIGLDSSLLEQSPGRLHVFGHLFPDKCGYLADTYFPHPATILFWSFRWDGRVYHLSLLTMYLTTVRFALLRETTDLC
jgi:hypothetical protein